MDGNPRTWRELLKNIIDDPRMRRHIATELGVNPITLVRWVNGDSNPRPQALHQLIRLLPEEKRKQMVELIEFEVPEMLRDGEAPEFSSDRQEIPAAFYSAVLQVFSTQRPPSRFWSLCQLILDQALHQLDPHRVGMILSLAQCMPPSEEGKIRSLRVTTERGSPPFVSEPQTLRFLGAESLVGYTVSTGRCMVIQDTLDDAYFSSTHNDLLIERSAAACSITRDHDIAACLLMASTQPNYFTPSRLGLLENYAALLGLAFEREDFYPPEDIALSIMPPDKAQKAHFADFRHRIQHILLNERRSMNLSEAERMAWQQIERELLQLGPEDLER